MAKSIFFKNPLEIIAEASRTDGFEKANISEANKYMNNILESYQSFEKINQTVLPYTAQMIPVLESKSPTGAKRYLVENDFLVKLMQAEDITVEQAMNQIAESNMINMADLYLVVEGEGSIKQLLDTSTAKVLDAGCPNNVFGRLKYGSQYFTDIRNAGIKVLQKQDTYVDMQDTDSMMITSKPNYTTKTDSNAFVFDDDINPMKGNAGASKHDNNAFASDDLEYGSMVSKDNKVMGKYDDKEFNSDDYEQGSMTSKNNGVSGKYDDKEFVQDDDTNPMKGSAGIIKTDSNSFDFDDENINGMRTGYKGF